MAKLANKHVLIVGGSGSGKSTAEIKALVEEADENKSAIICIDPHGPMARELFAHLCDRGHRHRVLYDRLADLDRVLKWDFLYPSTAKHPRERQGENETRCERFAEILLRRRGQGSAATSPSIEEWLLAALNLYIYQQNRRPLADIRFAFLFDHPTFQSMFDGCTDEETRYKFQKVIDERGKSFEAAKRLIDSVCKSAAFQVRTEHSGGFNFEHHLNNRGIIIVEGGEGGALSPNAMKTMMGAIILKSLSFLSERKRKKPDLVLCLDEVNNYDLVGEAGHEVKALATHRKYGLAMHIMTQRLDFPPGITDGVMTNCDTKIYMRSPHVKTANQLGADLGGGYETQGTKTHYLRDGSSWDSPDMISNPFADELRNFERGDCYTRRGNKNKKTRITPLPDPFDMQGRSLNLVIDGLLNQVKRRKEYFSPTNESPSLDDDMPSTSMEPPTKPDDDPLGI